MFTDIAVAIADGGTRITDIATAGDQEELFGAVASVPTAWRALQAAGEEERLAAVAAARAAVRAHVWEQITARHGRIPPCTVAGKDLGDMIVIRLDASIVIAHSDTELADRTFTKTVGHHPLTAWCDTTGELLAVTLRPGNAGSNTAADHIEVLTAAIAQIPAPYRRKLLVTVDGAGSTHALVDVIAKLHADPDNGVEIHYAVGFDLDERGRTAIGTVPARAGEPALDAEGTPRKGAAVAELTGLYPTDSHGDRLKGCRRTCGTGPQGATAPGCAAVAVRTSTRATGSSSPPPTCPAGRCSFSRPATRPRPGSRTGSAARRRRTCAGCR